MLLKIQTIDAPKQARIYWLSQIEAEDEAVTAFLHNDLALQREQGVLPVIVESGGGVLEESLYLLMKRQAEAHNTALEKAS